MFIITTINDVFENQIKLHETCASEFKAIICFGEKFKIFLDF